MYFNAGRSPHHDELSILVLLLRATSGGCEVRRGNTSSKDSHGSGIMEVKIANESNLA